MIKRQGQDQGQDQRQDQRVYCFGEVRVAPADFKIWRNGEELVLEPKTFQVLLYLLENRGRLVEKTELLDAVWKDTFVTENAMTREVAKLRKVLGDDPKEARYIQTVHTRGYRFIAEVREEDTDGTSEARSTLESETSRWSFTSKLLLGFGLAAVLAATIWVWRIRSEPREVLSVQKIEQITNWPGLDDYPALSPDGNSIAYCSDHTGSIEVFVRQLTPGAKEIQLTSDGGQNIQPAWSPDGQRIAYHSRRHGSIWVVPASGGEGKQLTDFGAYPGWSPDGALIVFQSGRSNAIGAFTRNVLPPSSLWVVPSLGGAPRPLTQLGKPSGGHGTPHWSPDGRHVAFTAEDSSSSSVWTVAVDGGALQAIAGNRSYDPVYARDGKSIILLGSTQQNVPGIVQQINIDSRTGIPAGEPVPVTGLAGASASIRRLSFSTRGKRLAYNALSLRGSLLSVTLTGSGEIAGPPVPLINNVSSRIHSPSFSPDGKRIAFAQCKAGGTFCDIWLINADGSNPTQLTTDSHNELLPNWFPDQKEISYLSTRNGYGTIWAINLDTRRERLLLDMKSDIEYARMSPDGRQLAFNFRKDGVVNVWMASFDGGEARQLTFDTEFMGFPNWSPDSQSLIVQMKRGENTHLAMMPSQGGSPVQLTSNSGQDLAHSWSADGNKVAFAGLRDGFWNLFWLNLADRTQKQLTHENKLNSYFRYPSWSPSGTQIVYEYSETTGNIWIADCN